MSYEDPAAAHAAGGFFQGILNIYIYLYIFWYDIIRLSPDTFEVFFFFFFSDHELRGHKISVMMAEKTALRHDHGYLYKHFLCTLNFRWSMLAVN